MNKHLDSIMSCKEKSRKTFHRLFSFLDNGCYCLLKVCYSQTYIKLSSTGNGKVTTKYRLTTLHRFHRRGIMYN